MTHSKHESDASNMEPQEGDTAHLKGDILNSWVVIDSINHIEKIADVTRHSALGKIEKITGVSFDEIEKSPYSS